MNSINLDCGEYTLRPYQLMASMSALSFFRGTDNIRALSVLPTGSGKSLVIGAIAANLDDPTIVFQPSREILVQNLAKIKSYGIRDVGVYSASAGSKTINKLTLVTIGSVVHKPELFQDFRNIIIDECHGVNARNTASMYSTFLNSSKFRIMGLTATPYRLHSDGFGGSIMKFLTRTRPRIFNRVIHVTQTRELFDAGYLQKPTYYQYGEFDTKRLRLNSTGADYEDKSVKNYYNEINFHDRIVNLTKDCLKSGRRNCLVFTRFIEDAEYVSKGIPGAAIVSSKTRPKVRDQLIKDFKSGRIKVVVNVGVLTTGFDFPELETIILARPTRSLALYYQMIGRCVRIHPLKDSAWVIDACDNFRKFGKLEEFDLTFDQPGCWYIKSNDRQLTNQYFDEIDPVPVSDIRLFNIKDIKHDEFMSQMSDPEKCVPHEKQRKIHDSNGQIKLFW